jgi:hypothetical protein
MLEFKEPKGGYHRRRQVNDIAMELRSYPNRSAIVRTYPIERQQNAHTYAYHINAGRHQAFTGCTASAVTENGVVNVYAMYPRLDDIERMSDAVCFDTVGDYDGASSD